MAKKKNRSSGRRRVSGIYTGGMATAFLGAAAGAIAATLVTSKLMAKQKDGVKAITAAGMGVITLMVVKNKTGQAAAGGMAAVAAMILLKKVKIGGIGAEPDTISIPVQISGPDDLQIIGGDDDLMSGDDLSVIGGEQFAMAGDYDDNLGEAYAMAGDEED